MAAKDWEKDQKMRGSTFEAKVGIGRAEAATAEQPETAGKNVGMDAASRIRPESEKCCIPEAGHRKGGLADGAIQARQIA